MSLGFIHGVMNTDNFSLGGFTIDYGPCAFMDEFKFNKVFSSIDTYGRYSYNNQASIAIWNILRLADCLIPFVDSNESMAISTIESELKPYFKMFEDETNKLMSQKLGIMDYKVDDTLLVYTFLKYLEQYSLDFHTSFRKLPELYYGENDYFPQTKELDNFLSIWKNRISDVEQLNNINPLYIPRNHQIEKMITRSYNGDYELFFRLTEVFKRPYEKQAKGEGLEFPPTIKEKVKMTFCGT